MLHIIVCCTICTKGLWCNLPFYSSALDKSAAKEQTAWYDQDPLERAGGPILLQKRPRASLPSDLLSQALSRTLSLKKNALK